MTESPERLYARYRTALGERSLPAAIVDLDALDANLDTLLAIVRGTGKTLRLATKSIRCPRLLEYIVEGSGGLVKGLMCYAVGEAALLVELGWDDILVAYPTLHASDADQLAALARRGKNVSIVVDAVAHLDRLEAAAAALDVNLPVVIEADVSFRPWRGLFHLGVRRSPLHEPAQVYALAGAVAERPHLRLLGVMGYEAQIAGTTDRNPFSPLMNLPIRLMKRLSRAPVAAMRAAIAEGLAQRGFDIEVFNGAGTGSLHWAAGEDALTEVTAGSGFLDSQLFDYYRALSLTPAAYFALQVVREPGPGYVTCHGGGYVASGEAGRDRLPRPALPPGLRLIDVEGAGEVQTPLRVPAGVRLGPGDPVFFRHAKAGELAEHFRSYLLVRRDTVEEEAATYRGLNQCFL